MKFLACFLAVALFAAVQAELTSEQTTRLNKFSDECRAITGVTKEMIDKLRRGEETDDQKMKEQVLCVCKKVGVMTEDGDIKMDLMRTKMSAVMTDTAKIDEIMNECCVKRDTPEETAMRMMRCMKKQRDLNKNKTFSIAD